MVFTAAFVGVTLLSGFTSAIPHPQANPVLSMVSAVPTATLVSSGAVSASPSADSSMVTAPSSAGGYSAASSDSSMWDSSSMATSTSMAYGSYSSPAYGSGSTNWGGSGYDGCVAQCIASFGSPPATYMPTATATTASSMGSSGSGSTITVIVAPTQGVLRYVPFAVNASVGDTIKFMWGANNHTVTKSSELTPCNKTSDAPFASGTQNKDFVFTQVVNDTQTTFFYCGTPGHCQAGMFGIINPPNALGSPTSVAGMMSSMSANNSDMSAYVSYTAKMTANNTKAGSWGANLDMASLPTWSHQHVAENVLFTRNFLAANPEVMQSNGFIDLSAAGTTPLMIPQDISAALSNAGSSTTTSSAPMSTSASMSMSTNTPAPSGMSSGAHSLTASNIFVALVVAVATWFAL